MEMPEITLTGTDPTTGAESTVAFDPARLVSVTLQHHPATVNPDFFRHLSAKEWRHQETSWYQKENEYLNQLLTLDPSLDPVLWEMRLLLYATFVKSAEERKLNNLYKGSRKHFDMRYKAFFKKWGRHPLLPSRIGGIHPERPDEYLEQIHSWSYFELKRLIQFRPVPKEQAP